jgi:hypothetical protein
LGPDATNDPLGDVFIVLAPVNSTRGWLFTQ